MLALHDQFRTPMERVTFGLARTGDLTPALAKSLCELDVYAEHYSTRAAMDVAGRSPQFKLVLEGWACEARHLPDGRRQIFSFAIPGDIVRLRGPGGSLKVVAITPVHCVDVSEVVAHVTDPEEMLAALERAAFLARERRYDHLTRLVSRSPVGRVASLLVELHDRLQQVGLVEGGGFALPLRHEEIADALGLSTVHVTRCLGILREGNLVTLQFRRVTGFDRAGLGAICELSPDALARLDRT